MPQDWSGHVWTGTGRFRRVLGKIDLGSSQARLQEAHVGHGPNQGHFESLWASTEIGYYIALDHFHPNRSLRVSIL